MRIVHVREIASVNVNRYFFCYFSPVSLTYVLIID